MLASIYTDDFERGNAMGIALGGLALGVLSKDILLPRGFAPAASPSHAAFGGLSILQPHGHAWPLLLCDEAFPLQSGPPSEA